MSMSPISSNMSDGGPAPKRKRSYSNATNNAYSSGSNQEHHYPHDGTPSMAHIPKRGSRACTNCRRGKNRCEFEPGSPCRRCQLSGLQCVFEKPEKKSGSNVAQGVIPDRVTRLEDQFNGMQFQINGMQSSLDRILNLIQSPPSAAPFHNGGAPTVFSNGGASSSSGRSFTPSQSPRDLQFAAPSVPSSRTPDAQGFFPPDSNGAPSQLGAPSRQSFPPLPGFAPPPHKFATYGIVPSTAPSSDDESEDTLPRASLNAPIEALQGLANAAAEAAAASLSSPRRPKLLNRKRVEPIPRNAFPNVIDKGLVAETEARELYQIFFSGCHLFIPLFDPSYDTFDSLRSRTPFCFDAILAVASKIRAGSGPPSETFHRCLEEAQGIARSTLFGPVVRKEAVQAMLLLAAWSTSGWLPSGHAMRMALDLGLHRALEKLAESGNGNDSSPGSNGRKRSDDEERDLVVSSRIWLCLYWFDHQMSLGTGRPVVLRDEGTIKHCRILLSHPMASVTDVRLIAQVELIAQKNMFQGQIHETLVSPLTGQVNNSTLAFVRRANLSLDKWWSDWDELHRSKMDSEALLRKILAGDLYYAKLWLVCVVLRGASWDKMAFEQRELAFQAKEAASDCLNTFLGSPAYRAALRYAVHDSLVTAAFSGLFLLKVANLFPREVDLSGIIVQVEQLAQLFSDVAAERYALTLRLMIVNLRRKVGLATGQQTPVPRDDVTNGVGMMDVTFDPHAHPLPPMTLEDLDFNWPSDLPVFSPTSIPTWLQETSLTDLSLPIHGSDGIFLPMGMSSLWPGDMPNYQAW